MTESAPALAASNTAGNASSKEFKERLVPGPSFYIMWILLIPAVLLAASPLSETFALPIAIGAYVLVVVSFIVMAPVIRVNGNVLSAGAAHIDVASLGDVETLNREALRYAIGQGTDVRNFLVIRGYIHSGVRVAVTDANDPTPHWIITTRKPEQLKRAILTAQAAR